MTDIFRLWNLRTHPFCPTEDGSGHPFRDPKFLLRPLNPQIDPRLIRFYFNHYDWQYSDLIHSISENCIFEHFPDQADLSQRGGVMLLITGLENTGRESLCNLVLCKIKQQFNAFPIRVEVSLQSNNMAPAPNIRTIAQLFMYSYRSKLQLPEQEFQTLKDIYNSEAGEVNPGEKDNYSTLFQVWGNMIRPSCQNPLILMMQGRDSYDLWRSIYASVSYLFQFIIVLTKDDSYAETCRKLLRQQGSNVALIKAQELDLEKARSYLQERLAQQRILNNTTFDPLFPFSEEVLQTLYQPGATHKKNDPPIKFRIGELNKTFIQVIEEALGKLPETAQKLHKNVENLTPDELLIQKDFILDAREKINQGLGG